MSTKVVRTLYIGKTVAVSFISSFQEFQNSLVSSAGPPNMTAEALPAIQCDAYPFVPVLFPDASPTLLHGMWTSFFCAVAHSLEISSHPPTRGSSVLYRIPRRPTAARVHRHISGYLYRIPRHVSPQKHIRYIVGTVLSCLSSDYTQLCALRRTENRPKNGLCRCTVSWPRAQNWPRKWLLAASSILFAPFRHEDLKPPDRHSQMASRSHHASLITSPPLHRQGLLAEVDADHRDLPLNPRRRESVLDV